MQLRGDVFRELEGRCTHRVLLDEPYFIKQHNGVGWKEIFKNLLQLRMPILSAKNEWQALEQLKQLNVAAPEVVGYGCRGINPARLQSFVMTRELPSSVSLEDFCRNWAAEKPHFALKQLMILKVAEIARTLHEHGINHRDFYICHFLLDWDLFQKHQVLKLYLIDLHRAQMRKKTPVRWQIKDLAGLYFSSKAIGLTQRDLLRFMQAYRAKPLRTILEKENDFWQKVKERGDKLYQKHEKT